MQQLAATVALLLCIFVAAATAANVGYFWHITDPHLDLEYQVGASKTCSMGQLCCRGEVVTDPAAAAGYWGEVTSKCDIPTRTFQSALDFVKNFSLNVIPRENGGQLPDFILYGGDAVAHDKKDQTREKNLENIKVVTSMLSKTFDGVPIPIYPILGNHDTYPQSQVGLPPSWTWLYGAVADMWRAGFPHLPESALATFEVAGWYSIPDFMPGLRLIAMETNYDDISNKKVLLGHDTADPAGQLAWLSSELEAARAAGDKVFILAHIPPGWSVLNVLDPNLMMSDLGLDDSDNAKLSNMSSKPWRRFGADADADAEASLDASNVHLPAPCTLEPFNKAFEAIAANYSDIIKIQFYGHTHVDSFKVFHDTEGRPAHVGFVNSAITPFELHLPAVRLYTYDRDTFDIIDYTQFVSNITAANELYAASNGTEGNELEWVVEYSAVEAYGLPDMSAASWANFTARMETDDELFARFHWNYISSGTVSADYTKATKKAILCTTQCVTDDCFRKCTL